MRVGNVVRFGQGNRRDFPESSNPNDRCAHRTTLTLSGGDQMKRATKTFMAWTVMAGVASIVGCSNGSGPKPGASVPTGTSTNISGPPSAKAEEAHAHKPSA